MKITLSCYDYNRIMRICTPAVSKDDTRETLRYIAIECKDGKGRATALDGFIMTQCAFDYVGDDGCFMLLPGKKVKESCDAYVDIEVKDGYISITNGKVTVIREYRGDIPYIDYRKIIRPRLAKDDTAKIYFSRAILLKLLKSFEKNEAICIQIAGATDPAMIRTKDACTIALPLKTYGTAEKDFAQWGVVVDCTAEGANNE